MLQLTNRRLRASGLNYTIVRPGKLTEEAGTGRVRMAERINEFGEIPREDVAAVIRAALDHPGTSKREFDLISGDTPVDEAVAALD